MGFSPILPGVFTLAPRSKHSNALRFRPARRTSPLIQRALASVTPDAVQEFNRQMAARTAKARAVRGGAR